MTTIKSRKAAPTNTLPSRFQIGDEVLVDDQVQLLPRPGIVAGVSFTSSAVRYLIDFGTKPLCRAFESYQVTARCGTSKAPAGWSCTRALGHTGPCAAERINGEDSQ